MVTNVLNTTVKTIAAFSIAILAILSASPVKAQELTATLPSGASLEVYLPAKTKANGRCILIIPGGGYRNLSVNGEGRLWAPWITGHGYVMAMLSYRMPNGHHNWPLQDGKEAMALLREKGEKWRINSGCIGVMGFSAGGHVASTIATHTFGEEAPDFQILFYPVITMDPTYTHSGSHNNLLGTNPSKDLEILYSNEKQVTKDTPPCFICYAANDGTVPIENSINYYKALVDNGVDAYIKEYPTGGHGFGFNTSFAYHNDMLNELETWLNHIDEILTPTAIDNISFYDGDLDADKSSLDDRWYDLNGRCVSTYVQMPPSPGVYIRGGKKILVK